MRQLEIEWKSIGARIEITLDEGRNASLVDPLWDSLPYRTLQGHALVAGDCLYHVPPAHGVLSAAPDHRVDRQAAAVGTVFCSAAQHLTIKYGALTEPMPAAPIGHVSPGDIASLSEIGQAVWDSLHGKGEPVIAQVRRLGGADGHQVRRQSCELDLVRDLAEAIAAESEKVLAQPPSELVALHQGRRFSGAGTKGSVLTTVLFVNGETRPLGYMTYTGLVRAARLTLVPLDSLIEMARLLLPKPSEFLGYCGLETLCRFTQQVIDVLDVIDGRDDFIALMEQMALYVNALGAWNLQLFPWELEPQPWTYDRQGLTTDVR